jgi:hypothetical protein
VINENKTRGDDRLRQVSLAYGRAIEENKKLREACREALLFMTAPTDSPRLSPVSRGNLTRILEEAIK